MKNLLPFKIPFSSFSTLDFISCFTSVFVFLENIDVGTVDYECRQLEGKSCNSCGNCGKGGSTPISVLEKYFFLFDTMCGRSSLRCRFDNEPTEMQKLIGENEIDGCGTDFTVDFLFGFAGFEYRKLSDSALFKNEIINSINENKPVIAKIKNGPGRFRVISGYDNDVPVCPNFINAQKRPENAPSPEELEVLYITGKKIMPRYTLIDGLRQIRQVMEYNAKENLWGVYIGKIGLYTPEGMLKVSTDEKKARFKRVAETMWHTFNCHNFAEVFRKYRNDSDAVIYDTIGGMKKLRAPEFKKMCNMIGGPCYGYTHDLAWALIGLEQCADWSKHASRYFGEMAELTLSQIAKNDAGVLAAVNEAITILENMK